MTGNTELVKALRHCTDNEPSNGDFWNCPYQGEKCHTLLSNAAAIEALQAEVKRLKDELSFSESSADEFQMQAALQNALLAKQIPHWVPCRDLRVMGEEVQGQ